MNFSNHRTRKTRASALLLTAPAAILLIGVLFSPPVHAQRTNPALQSWSGWKTTDQRSCVDLAQKAIRALGIPITEVTDWYVAAQDRNFHLGIGCVADDETSSLINSSVRRILISVTVAGNPGFDSAVARYRDFLGDAMRTGNVPDADPGPAETFTGFTEPAYGKGIPLYNNRPSGWRQLSMIKNVSLEQCKDSCRQNAECRSLEYNSGTRTCVLMNKNTRDGMIPRNRPDTYLYMEKK